jgi:hypothetical protein
MERQLAVRGFGKHTVDHDDVRMNVQVCRRTESLCREANTLG